LGLADEGKTKLGPLLEAGGKTEKLEKPSLQKGDRTSAHKNLSSAVSTLRRQGPRKMGEKEKELGERAGERP